MASITNKSLNTGSVTNKDLGATISWDDPTPSWDSPAAYWDSSGVYVTNKSINTGSVTNKALSTQGGLTFEETRSFTFQEIQQPFSDPWGIRNKTLNTGSVTNKTLLDP